MRPKRTEQEYLAVPLRVIARLKEAFYDLSLVHTSIDIVEEEQAHTTRFRAGSTGALRCREGGSSRTSFEPKRRSRAC